MASLPYPRSHQIIFPQNPQKFLMQDILPQIAQIRRVWHPCHTHAPNQTIFPQNPTQPNHLWASVRIRGRLFYTRSFCVFREFRGRTLRNLTICEHLCASVGGSSLPEVSVCSVNSVGEPYAAKPSVGICGICGRLFYARTFCEFREFRGRTLSSLTICEHL